MRQVLIGLPLAGAHNFDLAGSASRLAEKGFHCSVVHYGAPGAPDARKLIEQALCQSADLIFIDPSIVLFEDTIEHMLAVAASDPMIAFVSPRLNSPASHALPLSGTSTDPRARHRLAQRLAPRLPPATYVPNVATSCFYAKHDVMRGFRLDRTNTNIAQAIGDLVIETNRRGYCAAIANRTYAYDTRECPPISDGDGNAALGRHLRSPGERALKLLAQCETGDAPAVAFDFSTLGKLHNGTSEYSITLVAAFARLFGNRYRIDVLCAQDAWRFHGLDEIVGIRRASAEDDCAYAAVVRTSQPFTMESLALASSRGAVSLIVMHDAIAYDCLHLAPAELHRLWSFVMEFADGVIYVSKFSQQQLARRFPTGTDVAHVLCMPSTDSAEYAKARPSSGDYLLIVGNDFPHKALQNTVDLIRERFPALRLCVFGALLSRRDDVVYSPGGQLSSPEVATIFANARAVVYPSHYEGFGLPIMHALANRKRIFARDLPPYHEIKSKVAAPNNIHLFKDDAALLDKLAEADFAWTEPSRGGVGEGWEAAARNLEALLREKLQSTEARKIERRLAALDMLLEGIAGRRTRTELEEKVAHLENVVAHREQHLDAVHSSLSWRVTRALRAVGGLLRRQS